MKSILILLIVAFALLATSVDSHEGTHHVEGSGSHEGTHHPEGSGSHEGTHHPEGSGSHEGTHHAEGSGSHEGTHHAEAHSGSKTKRAIPSSLEDDYKLKARVKRHASSEENGTHHPGGHKPKRATSTS